jgi:putative sterol carrier protein
MASRDEVAALMGSMRSKMDDPVTIASLQNFSKTIQFTFPDLNTSFLFRIENGAVKEFSEASTEKPDIYVTTSSDTLVAIAQNDMSGMSAFMTGKLKVKGSMGDLMKLQKLM